jgi:thiamine-monophosphate kinase
MHQLKDIVENKIISDLTKSFKRSPAQLNKVHETDAEIIRLENSFYDLAVTIDTISEEIKTGLYTDPYQIGWMSVMVNLSDLAAVGATPLGIVISQILPEDVSNEFLEKLQNGINDACKKCGTFVLGGDTNLGEQLIISGCAIGTLDKEKYLSRVGCKTGDKIYITGKAGKGNAYAAQKLLFQNTELLFPTNLRERNLQSIQHHRFLPSVEMTPQKNSIGPNQFDFVGDDRFNYFPKAKLEWRTILNQYSSCCIDTSDGILSSLDQLMRINNCGFRFKHDWSDAIENSSNQLFIKNNLPLWLLLAGEHGEFELIFSIPAETEIEFLRETEQLHFKPIYLAEATEDSKIIINVYNKEQSLDTQSIRNFSFAKDFSPTKYLQKLLEIDTSLKST